MVFSPEPWAVSRVPCRVVLTEIQSGSDTSKRHVEEVVPVVHCLVRSDRVRGALYPSGTRKTFSAGAPFRWGRRQGRCPRLQDVRPRPGNGEETRGLTFLPMVSKDGRDSGGLFRRSQVPTSRVPDRSDLGCDDGRCLYQSKTAGLTHVIVLVSSDVGV